MTLGDQLLADIEEMMRLRAALVQVKRSRNGWCAVAYILGFLLLATWFMGKGA